MLYIKRMKKKITKSRILDACIQKQEELIKSFEDRVSVSKADAYEHEHSASQTENRTAGKVELLRTFEKELGFVRMEMEFLKSLNPEKMMRGSLRYLEKDQYTSSISYSVPLNSKDLPFSMPCMAV